MRKRRYIVHADMDAFFAAIEQRDNPQFRGKPVIVGADPKNGKGRGVVSTCSYEARVFGVHSAMPISIAYRKCPQAVFLPVDMEKYEAVSARIYDIFYDFTPDIEPVGIDEAFLDISGSYHLFGAPIETCLLMKKRVKKEVDLTVSCGLAPTKMAAKIASDLEKPDGMVEVQEERLLEFLWPLNIRKLWGLGPKSEEALNNIGIRTIGDLAKRDAGEIVSLFGKNGLSLWELANGIDERMVEPHSEAKSISNEITFEKDTEDNELVRGALMSLSEKVSDRMRQERIKGRTVTLKIRLEGFDTYTRSSTLEVSTNFDDTIYKEVKSLYDNFQVSGKKIRLIGVKVSNLVPSQSERSLFKETGDEKKEKAHNAIDKIKGKYGFRAIFRAGAYNIDR